MTIYFSLFTHKFSNLIYKPKLLVIIFILLRIPLFRQAVFYIFVGEKKQERHYPYASMKRTQKNKEANYLGQKMELYESFLYQYLPQLAALSFITRINIYDYFGSAGLDRTATLGTPFLIFQALLKQRNHQLKKKLPLKPFTLRILHPGQQSSFSKAFDLLLQNNTTSNTCKLESWPFTFPEMIKKLARQIQQQPASEKNLLLLDPLGIPQFSLQELRSLADKKVEFILYLPVSSLWHLHAKPEKGTPSVELIRLKQVLDDHFPATHPYWSPELRAPEFAAHLKEAFGMEGNFYSALQPAGAGRNESALLAFSGDAYMMEKILQAFEGIQAVNSPLPGEQLPLFQNKKQKEEPVSDLAEILLLLREETQNQMLYEKGLQAGFLPLQLQKGLSCLLEEGKIEVLDEKKKPLPAIPPNCIGLTAFKAAKPLCYFRLKE